MRCFGCDAEIPKARLVAVPWTHHCVLCATEIELRKNTLMTQLTEYLDNSFKWSGLLQGDYTLDRTPEQAADDRANNLLGRQIERIEGFDES